MRSNHITLVSKFVFALALLPVPLLAQGVPGPARPVQPPPFGRGPGGLPTGAPRAPVSAAQPVPPTFAAGDYPAFLATLPQELTPPRPGAPVPLENLVRVAIALEKSGGWQGPAGKQAYDLLKDNPDATQILNALQALVEGKPEGLPPIADSKLLQPMSLMLPSRTLREHGFDFAANALGALSPDMPGRRVVYLLNIPADKRPAVETVLLAHVNGPMNQAMLAQAALQLFLRPPQPMDLAGLPAPDPHDCFLLAMKLGKGTNLVSLDTAQEIEQSGKKPEAEQLVTMIAAESPADDFLQVLAVRRLRTWGDVDGATALLQQALTTVPEPRRRTIRLAYLDYLRWQKKDADIVALEAGKDPLMAADAALVLDDCPGAAQRFRDVLDHPETAATQNPGARPASWTGLTGLTGLNTPAASNAEETARVRVAAWLGLLDADPDQALTLAKDVLDTLPHPLAPSPSRPLTPSPLVGWIGRQFWSVVNRDIPHRPGFYAGGGIQHFVPMHEVPDWEKRRAFFAWDRRTYNLQPTA